jgi:hypothetical protein
MMKPGPCARRRRSGLVVTSLGVSLGLGLALVHCASPTEIVVEVWSEACGPTVQVGFTGANSLAELQERELTSAAPPGSCPVASATPQRVGRIVLSPSGERDGTVAFEVVTRRDGADPASCGRPLADGCIIARRQLAFVPRSTVTMRVDLRTACENQLCDGATCSLGSCKSAETACKGGTCDEQQLGSLPPADPSDAGLTPPAPDADASRVPTTPPARPLSILQIVAGANHTCVRWSDHQVTCWGANADGQADPSPTSDVAPRTPSVVYRAEAGTELVTIGAGGSSTCVALSAAPGVQCWGAPASVNGQAAGVRTIVPTTAPPLLAKELALGKAHACAGDAAGQLWCWGESGQSQYFPAANPLGLGRASLQNGFPLVSMLVTSPLADFVCGVQNKNVLSCLGPAPALLNGWSFASPPEAVGLSPTVACVTMQGGTKICNPARDVPAILGATLAWAGGENLCHLDANGVVECSAPSGVSVTPKTIPGARLLAVGQAHSCVVVGDAVGPDEVFCWGDNRLGQLAGPAGLEAVKVPQAVQLGR